MRLGVDGAGPHQLVQVGDGLGQLLGRGARRLDQPRAFGAQLLFLTHRFGQPLAGFPFVEQAVRQPLDLCALLSGRAFRQPRQRLIDEPLPFVTEGGEVLRQPLDHLAVGLVGAFGRLRGTARRGLGRDLEVHRIRSREVAAPAQAHGLAHLPQPLPLLGTAAARDRHVEGEALFVLGFAGWRRRQARLAAGEPGVVQPLLLLARADQRGYLEIDALGGGALDQLAGVVLQPLPRRVQVDALAFAGPLECGHLPASEFLGFADGVIDLAGIRFVGSAQRLQPLFHLGKLAVDGRDLLRRRRQPLQRLVDLAALGGQRLRPPLGLRRPAARFGARFLGLRGFRFRLADAGERLQFLLQRRHSAALRIEIEALAEQRRARPGRFQARKLVAGPGEPALRRLDLRGDRIVLEHRRQLLDGAGQQGERALGDAGDGRRATDRLQQIAPGVLQPVGRTGEPARFRRPGAAHLLGQRIEDHPLRFRRLAGLDQGLDQFLLAVGERDADAAERREPFDRVFQRLAQLRCRRRQVLAEHRRHVLRQRQRPGEGITGNGAEGGEDRGRVLHALGGGQRRGLDAVGEGGYLLRGQAGGIAGRLQHRFQPAVGLIGLRRLLDALAHRDADAGERGSCGKPKRAQPGKPRAHRTQPPAHRFQPAAHLARNAVQRLQRAGCRPRRVLDPLQRAAAGVADIAQFGLDPAAVDDGQANGKRTVGHGSDPRRR